MGIPGLVQWLVEHHCAAPLNGGLPALITPERNRFIVDANAWSQMVTTLLHDKTDRMRGGQWALVYAVCEAFVAELCAAGAHLVFIFDGVRPASKSSVLKHRRWFYSTKAWRKAQACADYNHQVPPPAVAWTRPQLGHGLAIVVTPRNRSMRASQ